MKKNNGFHKYPKGRVQDPPQEYHGPEPASAPGTPANPW